MWNDKKFSVDTNGWNKLENQVLLLFQIFHSLEQVLREPGSSYLPDPPGPGCQDEWRLWGKLSSVFNTF